MALRKVSSTVLVLATTSAFVLSVRAPVAALYRIKSVGLDAFQLVIVGIVLELSVFAAEIPTGVIADIFGRRPAIIAGYVLMGLGFAIEASIPQFAFVLLGQVFFGVGYTFTSGAVAAWIADEVGQERFERLLMRRVQFGAAGSVVALGCALPLGRVSFVYPLYLSAAVSFALAVFLFIAMPETRVARKAAFLHEGWLQFRKLFRDGLRLAATNRRIRDVIIASMFIGAMSEPVDRLWELHMITRFHLSNATSVTVFVAMQIAALGVSALVAEYLHRAVAFRSLPRTKAFLMIVTAAVTATLLIFALSRDLALAAAAFVVIGGLRAVLGPAFSAWTNEQITGDVRATVFSIQSQSDASGQVVGGLAIGKLAVVLGVPAALSAAAALLVPIQWLYHRAK